MLFSDPFREFDALTEALLGRARGSIKSIPMDVRRDDSAVHFQFEIPGVKEENISLEVDRNMLTLTVDRPYEEAAGERLISERPFGVFRRQISLSDGLNVEEASASFENGVLSLTIPVAEKAKPRKIAIGKSEAKELSSS